MHQTALRLILIAIVFLILVSYPVAAAFNHTSVWLGVPALVWYLFGIWAALVLVLFFVMRTLPQSQKPSQNE
jgi:hypothetical protein